MKTKLIRCTLLLFVLFFFNIAAYAQIRVTWKGGPIYKRLIVVPIYLGNEWIYDSQLANLRYSIDSFVSHLLDSDYMDGLNEYGCGRGYTGTSLVYSDSPPSSLDDSQIQYVLAYLRYYGSLPNDSAVTYLVIPPPWTSVTRSGQGPLGYHSGFFFGRWVYPSNPYANFWPMNYTVVNLGQTDAADVPNSRSSFDNLTAVISHEVSEICTDPMYWCGRLAWTREGFGANAEVADIPQPSTQFLDGYLVSEYFANRAHTGIVAPDPIRTATLAVPSRLVAYQNTPLTLTVRAVPQFRLMDHVASGTIYIFNNGNQIASVSVPPEAAVLPQKISLTGILPVGVNMVQAVYSGDGHYFLPSSSVQRKIVVRP